MVNRDRMLALGVILTILAMHIGASLANTNDATSSVFMMQWGSPFPMIP